MNKNYQNLIGIASDYSIKNNWMYLDECPKSAADVIFFYPTAYMNPQGELVSEITDQGMREKAKNTYQIMGSIFEEVGNIYVPYYRQVNGAEMADMSYDEIRQCSWLEPRTDLYAALDYYFEHYNSGKPFILAGHSQGSMMLSIVLSEYMRENPQYYERMIAAYMLGFSLTADFLQKNPHLKAAQSAEDLGVIISWNTLGENNSGTTNLVVLENSVCINPLNWRTDEAYAGVEQNLGSYLPDANEIFHLEKGAADAQIDPKRGIVICKSVDPEKYSMASEMDKLFGKESYHKYDYGFYYENIRQNAKKRVQLWLNKHVDMI